MKQLSTARPHVIILMGIPGAGKTTFAERFTETFATPYVNQTALEREFTLNIDQAASVAEHMIKELIKTKHTFLYEGPMDLKQDRQNLMTAFIKAGYTPLLLWVQTDPVEARRRALKPLPTGSGMTHELFDDALRLFEQPDEKEHAVVISGRHTYASQLKIVLSQLSKERPVRPLVPPRPSPSRAPRARIQ